MNSPSSLFLGLAAIVVVGASSPAPTLSEAAPRVSPALLRAEIGRSGARAVVGKLWDGGQWEAVMAHIDGGEGSWVALAPALEPGTDAGASEELGIALAYALPRNPMAVLAVLDPNNGPTL